ncbi:MAG: EAL domain-containing protein [Alicyclobacillaceae bacterium]|nr:EAL domain-containing protein [Alicyclobacillaceae bacterium]
MYGVVPRFQPIVDVLANRKIGFEATIRGLHGESAQDLFQNAVKQSKVTELDRAARAMAIEDGVPMLGPGEKLFLNIAPQSLGQDEEWLPKVAPLNRIVLEITEQLPVERIGEIQDRVRSLRRRGVEWALDDFGAGFSNLDSLTKLPLSYVKLDKQFAADVTNRKTADAIKHYCWMFQDMGIRLVVEGVETREQKQRLMDLGVRFMQGFHFGYPKTAEEYAKRVSLGPLS